MKKNILLIVLLFACQIVSAKEYSFQFSLYGGGYAISGGSRIDQGTEYTINLEEGTYSLKLYAFEGYYATVKVNDLNLEVGTEVPLDNGGKASLSTDLTLKVTFHSDVSISIRFKVDSEIPSLRITSYGNGTAYYNGNSIRKSSSYYTVPSGTTATISLIPDDGYKIEMISLNGSDISISNSITITINSYNEIHVWFTTKPTVKYTLSVNAKGSGEVFYDGNTIRNDTKNFTVDENDSPTITFSPDYGNRIKSVKLNGNEVFYNNNSYTLVRVYSDNTFEVDFEELERNFTKDGISYEVSSFSNNSVIIGDGNYGLSINVPEKVFNQEIEWNIIGISEKTIQNNTDLAAIVWNPDNNIDITTKNPNLLLYVKDVKYAPTNINNVVVGDEAESIILTESQSSNNFYCPKSFTAKDISYSHRYRMRTGGGESKGWETIALPFDVQKIEHAEDGEIVPFMLWSSTSTKKPFWLYQMSSSGFVETYIIKANTPYIISMPNNEVYKNDYIIRGTITFSSTDAIVKKSDEVERVRFGNRTFVPNFINLENNAGYYALNVNNDIEVYQGSENEGSVFIQDLRRIHPFEAYMTSTAATRSIGIFDGMTTAIKGINDIENGSQTLKVYNLNGQCIKTGTSMDALKQDLPAGLYIINNKKIIIK